MTKSMILLIAALTCALPVAPTRADPPKKLTDDERKELQGKRKELVAAGHAAFKAGQIDEAVRAFEEGLKVNRKLYNTVDFPDGHADIASSLNNLGFIYLTQRKYAEAEPILKECLDLRRKLHNNNDHADVAVCLNNLGSLYQALGRYAAAEPLLVEALDMYRRLFKDRDQLIVATSLNNLGLMYHDQGRFTAAEPLLKDSLGMLRRLFKDKGHAAVARTLNNLAQLHLSQSEWALAEPLFKEALDMTRRLSRDKDDWDVAEILSNFAALCSHQGKYAAAEKLYNESIEMCRRLSNKNDHPALAFGLRALGSLYREQRKYAAAEQLHEEALGMYKRLSNGADRMGLAESQNSLALVYHSQRKYAAAESLYKSSIEMYKRLSNNKDRMDLASNMSNLGLMYLAQGKYEAAEPQLTESLHMFRRLFGDKDHPALGHSLNHHGLLYYAQGKYAEAESMYRQALEMKKRSITAYARYASEGAALTFLAAQLPTRDAYLSTARLWASAPASNHDPATTYAAVWASKGLLARAYEQRHLRARAATDSDLTRSLSELTAVRRRWTDLLLAPPPADPDTAKQRLVELKRHDERIANLEQATAGKLPEVARIKKLDGATPDELRKALPADTALADVYRYAFFEWDNAQPPGQKQRWTARYAVFVVTRGAVKWTDLGPAATIEAAVGQWREAITTPPFAVPPDLPAKVRELVWAPVRKHLPAGIKVVYVCPDEALTRVPWGAVPGDKPGTIVLEEFAVAAVPHAPFLLDALWPRDKRENPPPGLLAVGGVAYGKGPAKPVAAAVPLPVDPTKAPIWADLPGTGVEAEQVAKRADGRKLPVRLLTGADASVDGVLAELPKARYAHLAAHGFFADKQFRSALQLAPKEYTILGRGEREGRAANSPLVLSGVALAGANDPKALGRGVLTGEHLIDRDLSGLELAVLSACETGLGDVAGGEGVYGLQRAFHYAGARNAVVSLWKVPDAATAALMGEFYRHLWDEKSPVPPIEALRQAQLALYRADPKQFVEMARRGPGLGDTDYDQAVKAIGKLPVNKDGKNPPVVWAAWSLSGPGH